jgi:hypothetical protein
VLSIGSKPDTSLATWRCCSSERGMLCLGIISVDRLHIIPSLINPLARLMSLTATLYWTAKPARVSDFCKLCVI